ncbi:MAG: hypothetical protein KJO35_06635, partial [Gammaproteobacteria bacterium]|nr:hypothetical protein [Gammaproteobacteria bacterium]
MKNFLRGTALLMVLSFGSAQAATIDGTLNFTGEAVPVFGPGLADAVGLQFSNFFVVNASGDLATAGIADGDTGTISDFFFDDAPITPFIQIDFNPGPGKFSFDLLTVQIEFQSSTFLALSGSGILSGTGFDDTAYNFSLSVDGEAPVFSSSGTLAPT